MRVNSIVTRTWRSKPDVNSNKAISQIALTPPVYRSPGALSPSNSKQQAEAPPGQKWSNRPTRQASNLFTPQEKRWLIDVQPTVSPRAVREPVPADCLDERRGEVGGRIQHQLAPGSHREAGVCKRSSERRSDMPLRHDPVAFRKRCPDQQQLEEAPRIAAFGHVQVAPNPAAADRIRSYYQVIQ